jgi:hypothetical protein
MISGSLFSSRALCRREPKTSRTADLFTYKTYHDERSFALRVPRMIPPPVTAIKRPALLRSIIDIIPNDSERTQHPVCAKDKQETIGYSNPVHHQEITVPTRDRAA